jgi:DNA-binding transcriptional regulator YdaS (Cro superfamily)
MKALAAIGMDAVKQRISMARLAREIGVTRGAVAQWKRVPAERLGDVTRATGIPMELLRPDLFAASNRPQPVKAIRIG